MWLWLGLEMGLELWLLLGCCSAYFPVESTLAPIVAGVIIGRESLAVAIAACLAARACSCSLSSLSWSGAPVWGASSPCDCVGGIGCVGFKVASVACEAICEAVCEASGSGDCKASCTTVPACEAVPQDELVRSCEER